MKKKAKPFETKFHALTGNAAMDLHRKEDFNALAVKLIHGYNPDRFDAVALRFFIQKDSPVVTLYAVDKYKQEQDNYPSDKLPVKKYKLKLSFEEFLRHIKRFDVTVSNDAYDIGDILVMNK
jgi:hypothetical protein